jgi:hypothetical protein
LLQTQTFPDLKDIEVSKIVFWFKDTIFTLIQQSLKIKIMSTHITAVNPSQIMSYKVFLQFTKDDAFQDERSKINYVRMKRIEKQTVPNEGFFKLSQKYNQELTWLIIAEPWCGDGSQSIPVIHAIAALFPKIRLQIILRDKNLEIMDSHLTNGKRAIPKLICIDSNTGKELWNWGPRPKALDKLLQKIKLQNPEITKEELSFQTHLWYANDKGVAIQQELFEIINE